MTDKEKALESESIKNSFSNNILAKEFKTDKRFVFYNEKKEPVNEKGYSISISNPNNLISFENTLIGFKNSPKIKGIGIALGNTPKGNLCGIDIDNCINEKGAISPKAKEIIDYLDSYTEISPSGTGIHILFYAEKIGNRCKVYFHSWCKCIEMYDKDRYFTLTGKIINAKGIENRQAQCNNIYRMYFEQDNKNSKPFKLEETSKNIDKKGYRLYLEDYALSKDPVLNKYWNGHRSHKSESDDDFALMGKLLYWLKNIDLAIEYFMDSPFAKTKDEYHLKKMHRKNYLLNTAMNIVRRNGWRIA